MSAAVNSACHQGKTSLVDCYERCCFCHLTGAKQKELDSWPGTQVLTGYIRVSISSYEDVVTRVTGRG